MGYRDDFKTRVPEREKPSGRWFTTITAPFYKYDNKEQDDTN